MSFLLGLGMGVALFVIVDYYIVGRVNEEDDDSG
jgi:hypothetical protein